jgi:hypothetical protein
MRSEANNIYDSGKETYFGVLLLLMCLFYEEGLYKFLLKSFKSLLLVVSSGSQFLYSSNYFIFSCGNQLYLPLFCFAITAMDELNFHESDSRRKRLEEGRSNDSC